MPNRQGSAGRLYPDGPLVPPPGAEFRRLADSLADVEVYRDKPTRYWPDWGCSDPPEESCSDAACPVHGWDDLSPEIGDEG